MFWREINCLTHAPADLVSSFSPDGTTPTLVCPTSPMAAEDEFDNSGFLVIRAPGKGATVIDSEISVWTQFLMDYPGFPKGRKASGRVLDVGVEVQTWEDRKKNVRHVHVEIRPQYERETVSTQLYGRLPDEGARSAERALWRNTRHFFPECHYSGEDGLVLHVSGHPIFGLEQGVFYIDPHILNGRKRDTRGVWQEEDPRYRSNFSSPQFYFEFCPVSWAVPEEFRLKGVSAKTICLIAGLRLASLDLHFLERRFMDGVKTARSERFFRDLANPYFRYEFE